jgi:hypothetical protein
VSLLVSDKTEISQSLLSTVYWCLKHQVSWIAKPGRIRLAPDTKPEFSEQDPNLARLTLCTEVRRPHGCQRRPEPRMILLLDNFVRGVGSSCPRFGYHPWPETHDSFCLEHLLLISHLRGDGALDYLVTDKKAFVPLSGRTWAALLTLA